MINNNEKIDINKCINFIKKHIDIGNIDISNIEINTKLPYYVIKVVYSNKNIDYDKKSKKLFSEYIIEKNNSIILHCFSSITTNSNYNYNKIEKKHFNFKNLLKFFYYNDNWVTITEFKDFKDYIKKTFNNINDIYEILNKKFYYTYVVKDEKLIFISKGEINNIIEAYNEMFENINSNNDEYVLLIKKNDTEKDKECKYGLKCINSKCYYEHPKEYNLYESYKQNIINEKIKNPIFKSINCKNSDEFASKHKYNKCTFIHKGDPIDF